MFTVNVVVRRGILLRHCGSRISDLQGLLNQNPGIHCRHISGLTAVPPSYKKTQPNPLFGTILSLNRGKSGYCIVDDCTRSAMYGPEEDSHGTFCKLHKSPDHMIMGSIRCQHAGCGVVASFGSPEDRKKRLCNKHKREGDINLRQIRCEHRGCRKTASYGSEGDRTVRHCGLHRTPTEVYLKRALCSVKGCRSQATFGFPLLGHNGQTDAGEPRTINPDGLRGEIEVELGRPLWCAKHARTFEGTENLVSPRCAADGCTMYPQYGPPGGRRMFCSKHKGDSDVNITVHNLKLEAVKEGYGLDSP